MVAFAVNGVELEPNLSVCKVTDDIETKTCIWIVRIQPEEAFLAVGQAVAGVIEVGVGGWDRILLLPEVVETVAVLVETGKWPSRKNREADSDGEALQTSAVSGRGDVRETGSGLVASFHMVRWFVGNCLLRVQVYVRRRKSVDKNLRIGANFFVHDECLAGRRELDQNFKLEI